MFLKRSLILMNNKKKKGLEIITSKEILQRLPIVVAQGKARDTSET